MIFASNQSWSSHAFPTFAVLAICQDLAVSVGANLATYATKFQLKKHFNSYIYYILNIICSTQIYICFLSLNPFWFMLICFINQLYTLYFNFLFRPTSLVGYLPWIRHVFVHKPSTSLHMAGHVAGNASWAMASWATGTPANMDELYTFIHISRWLCSVLVFVCIIEIF